MDPLHYNDFREPDIVFFVEVNGVFIIIIPGNHVHERIEGP